MIIALLLSLVGVRQVQFGETYYNFLKSVGRAYANWSFEIPKIPNITPLQEGGYDSGGFILAVIIKIANFFVTIINGLITVLNVVIIVLNVVIQLIQFCLTLIYCLLDFRNWFGAIALFS